MCDCADGPMCGWRHCGERAAWSVYQSAWPPRGERFQFMCDTHKRMYFEKIPGIDRPGRARADEDWRPSLTDMMILARINAAKASPPGRRATPQFSRDARYSPAQLAQVMVLRSALRSKPDA